MITNWPVEAYLVTVALVIVAFNIGIAAGIAIARHLDAEDFNAGDVTDDADHPTLTLIGGRRNG